MFSASNAPLTLDPPEDPPSDQQVFELIAALLVGSATQREAALKALPSKRYKRQQTIRFLIQTLEDRNEWMVLMAARALEGFGRSALNQLILALNHPSQQVRERVVWALWEVNDPRALEHLISVLRYDTAPKVRRLAACGLGQSKSVKAINPLIKALDDEDARVRWDAAVALAKIGTQARKPLIIAALYGCERVRLGAVNALAWIRDPRAIRLLKTLVLNDSDAEVRTRAAFALGWIGSPKGVEPLKRALRDRDAQVRLQAVVALGWLRDPASVAYLFPMLDDSAAWVPYMVVDALSSIGTAEALEALKTACVHPDEQVADHARSALMRHGLSAPVRKERALPDGKNPIFWLESASTLRQRRCQWVITSEQTPQPSP